MTEKKTKKAETVEVAVPQIAQAAPAVDQGGTIAERLDKMSIYIPKTRIDQNPVGRLVALGEKLDRSVNYLVVDAVLQYLEREEK